MTTQTKKYKQDNKADESSTGSCSK